MTQQEKPPEQRENQVGPVPALLSHIRESRREMRRLGIKLTVLVALALAVLNLFSELPGFPLGQYAVDWSLGMALALPLITLTSLEMWRREKQFHLMLTLAAEISQRPPGEIDWQLFCKKLCSLVAARGVGLYLLDFKTGKLSLASWAGEQLSPALPAELSQKAAEELKSPLPAGTKTFPYWHQEMLYSLLIPLPRRKTFSPKSQSFLQLASELIALSLVREGLHQQLIREFLFIGLTDPLTELYNRRYFHQALEQEFNRSRRYNSPLSLLYLDLDNLKELNDAYGHSTGDDALVKIAEILKQNLRNSDIAARVGGDKFVLILSETGAEGAKVVAQRIADSLSLCSIREDAKVPLRVSQGIAVLHQEDKNIKELLQRADMALYRAKTSGEGIAEEEENSG